MVGPGGGVEDEEVDGEGDADGEGSILVSRSEVSDGGGGPEVGVWDAVSGSSLLSPGAP